MSCVVSKDDGIIIYYSGPTMMKMYGRAIGIYLTLNQASAKYDMQYQNTRYKYDISLYKS